MSNAKVLSFHDARHGVNRLAHQSFLHGSSTGKVLAGRLQAPLLMTTVMRGGCDMDIQTTDPVVLRFLLNDVSVGCHGVATNVSWQASSAFNTPECSWLPHRNPDRFGHTPAAVAHAFLVTVADDCRPQPQSEHHKCRPQTVPFVPQPHCPQNCSQQESAGQPEHRQTTKTQKYVFCVAHGLKPMHAICLG